MRGLLAPLLALTLWIADIDASYGIDENAKAGYFNFDNDYVFAMNPTANGDIYFHMSAPTAPNCWIGAGFGHEMKDALMFIAYAAGDGRKLTVSARIGSGHTEPKHIPDIEVVGVYNDTYAPNPMTVTKGGAMIAHGYCRNCTKWATGELDFESTEQPLIFALGPKCSLASDSLEASIPRHRTYGRYTMNMPKAVNSTGWYGRVPAPNIPDFVYPPTDAAFVSAWTSPEEDVHHMANRMPSVHAALMCIAFVAIFPAGSLMLIFLKRVLVHAALQVLGVVVVIAGFGVGISISKEYNKSRDFNSAHQGIGLLIVAALLIQLSLGIIHHLMYTKSKEGTMFGKVHFFLGPSIMILGLINAGVGFDFAGRPKSSIPYGIVAGIVALIFFSVLGCLMCFKQRRRYRPDQDGPVQPFPPEGHQAETPGPYQDFELNRQTTFGTLPPEPYEPTTPYSPRFDVPYTPVEAYTPVTPKTWKKEEITNWSNSPYSFKGDDYS